MKKQYIIKKIPFLPMLSAFATGILMQYFFAFSFRIILLFFAIGFLINVSVFFLPVNVKYKCRNVLGCLLLLSFTALGSLLLWKQNIENDKFFAGNYSNIKAYFVRLKEPLSVKPKSYKSLASIEKILVNDKWIKASGGLFVYFKKDSSNKNLEQGSEIIFVKQPQPIRNAGNPGEFDYAAYCRRKGIYFQQFLSRNDYAVLKEKRISFAEKYIGKIRNWVTQTLDKNIEGNEAQSVAKALLLGNSGSMDKDIVQAFSDAGIIRLLSTSGLHLILIVQIFALLCNKIIFFRRRRVLQAVFIIVFIWFFAFLEGITPSVLRAAIVLSIYHFAEIVGRKHDAYNALALSAFIILIINPYYLFDAGFLLTYAALLSIKLFFGTVFYSVKIKNKLLKFLWLIIALSLSAQMLALPFILYYFHKFPLLFLLSNIVSMPLSMIIVYLEIVLLLFSPMPVLSKFIGTIIRALSLLLDKIIWSIAHLKFAVIESPGISCLQIAMLLAAFFALHFFIIRKWKNGITVFLSCLVSCVVIGFARYQQRIHQQKIIVYNIQKHFVIDCLSGHFVQSFSDTFYTKNSDEFIYVIKPARDFYNINKSDNSLCAAGTAFPLIRFGNKTIFILNDKTVRQIENASNADAVIVSKNYYLNFTDLKNKFSHAVFVFTNENSLWKIDKWESVCDSLHLQFHSIPQMGAFTVNL